MSALKLLITGAVCAGSFAGAWWYAQAAGTKAAPSSAVADPTPKAEWPEGALRIERPDQWWAASGFVSLTPPVHLPGGTKGRSMTRIWLKIPEGAQIRTVEGPQGLTLAYPEGTVADRVEYWRPSPEAAYRVADVRGARVEAGGAQTYRVFRPSAPADDAPLFGFEWPRGDEATKAQIHAEIYAAMDRGVGFARPTSAKARRRGKRVYAARSGCAGCHSAHRPDLTEGPSPINVNRGTDAAGFFTPKTLLVDHAPLEGYRPDDPNAADPCVSARCPDGGEATVTRSEAGARITCPGAAVPQGRLDLACALSSADPDVRAHGESLCAGRAYLYDHLDARGRAAFSEAFAACGRPHTQE